jgi:AhpD family alkylhydroperoxidase
VNGAAIKIRPAACPAPLRIISIVTLPLAPMARLPYAPIDTPELRPLVERIVAERGSVLHLYQMLLHSAPLAEGWLNFLTAVRHKLDLPGDLRELVIMRVAILNGAPYEADQHRPIALKEGVSPDQLDALADWQAAAPTVYPERERAVLALCDSMTRDIHVPAELMAAVVTALGQRQAVELAATIAAYNMVSRFLEALQIHSDDPR